MASPLNHTGKGGKSFQDRELAAKVRTLSLEEIQHILKNFGYTTKPKSDVKPEDRKLYEGVILNLSKTVLPRLNEHTGEGGEPIKFTQVEVTFK